MKTQHYFMLFVFLLMQGLQAQEIEKDTKTTDSIRPITPYSLYQGYSDPSRYRIGGGLFIPQGELGNYIGISPLVEVALHIPAIRNHSIDIAVQFIIPNQKKAYQIPTTIGFRTGESFFISNYFMRFNKNLLAAEKEQRLEIGLGLGASTLLTAVRGSELELGQDTDLDQNVTVLMFMPSINYKFKPYDNSLFSIGVDLQYSPYRIQGAVEDAIGGLAISPRITYTF